MIAYLFNLGPMEILILGVLGLTVIGVPIGVIVIVLISSRRRSQNAAPDLIADLERENADLREELFRAKRDNGTQGPSSQNIQ